jgi:hypothetical protein
MAVTWATLRARAQRRYGLAAGTDDPFFADALFLDAANDALKQLARNGAFVEDFSLNLSTSLLTNLGGRVLRVVDGTLRLDYAGDGQFLTVPERTTERALRSAYGALEVHAAGKPSFYYTRRGVASGAALRLGLFPRSDRAVVSGLAFSALVYPTPLALDADTLPLQDGEEDLLLPGILLTIAEADANRGRADGIVQLWAPRWREALASLADAVEDSRRGDSREVVYIDTELDF